MMDKRIGKVVKTRILPGCGWLVCCLSAFLLASAILNWVDMKTHLFRNEDTVVMPDEITREWLEETLSIFFYLNCTDEGSESYEISTVDDLHGLFEFYRPGRMMSFETQSDSEEEFEYTAEIVNDWNQEEYWTTLFYDPEKKVFILRCDIDVAAGISRRQLIHVCQQFEQAMTGFHEDLVTMEGLKIIRNRKK